MSGSPPPPAHPSSPSTSPATPSAANSPSPPTTTPTTAPAPATPTTSPAQDFDAVIVVTDSAGDTPALHAPATVCSPASPRTPAPCCSPSSPPTPRCPAPLRGPAFSSYAADEVGWLLQDLSDVGLEAPTEEREEAVQRGGAHYAESLPGRVPAQRGIPAALPQRPGRLRRPGSPAPSAPSPTRSSPNAATPRAGLPRPRRDARRHPDAPLGAAAARPRPAPLHALHRARPRHRHHRAALPGRPPRPGRRRLRRRLDRQGRHHPRTRRRPRGLPGSPGFDPDIAVLADPGGCVRTYGTREDFLIPSACLNSTVSGLVSRTVLRADLVGPGDFHGAKFYRDLAGSDVSGDFLDTVSARFADGRRRRRGRCAHPAGRRPDRAPTWEGWKAVEHISETYGIGDVNLVKPGVGETTRVLLRRVPWRILARRGAGPDLDHVRLLAEQRGVPVEEVDDLPYSCVGLIHPRYTRGATGADGKAVPVTAALVASDLDRTLIYSAAALGLTMPDDRGAPAAVRGDLPEHAAVVHDGDRRRSARRPRRAGRLRAHHDPHPRAVPPGAAARAAARLRRVRQRRPPARRRRVRPRLAGRGAPPAHRLRAARRDPRPPAPHAPTRHGCSRNASPRTCSPTSSSTGPRSPTPRSRTWPPGPARAAGPSPCRAARSTPSPAR